MSYKVISDAKRTKREEAIEEAAAVTTRELSKDERNIVSSSGTYCASAFPSFLSLRYYSLSDCSSHQGRSMDVYPCRDRIHQVRYPSSRRD